MQLSAHLSRLRKAKRLTQKAAADYLTKYGPKTYTFKIISQWETGVSEPSVEAFLLLCELYGVEDIRREFGVRDPLQSEKEPKTGALNALGHERMTEYAQLLSRDPMFRAPAASPITNPVRLFPEEKRLEEKRLFTVKLYDLPASAGSGVFLDDDAYEDYETDDEAAESADFAIRISGDSMYPEFNDGQVVFVEQTQTLRRGEIGIFTLNGEGYCKVLGDGCLVSINEAYDPIELEEYDSLYVIGRVLG